MRYYHRRIEIGKMLVDIVKYLITIAIIGSLITEKLTIKMSIFGVGTSLLLLLLAFFVIPPGKEK